MDLDLWMQDYIEQLWDHNAGLEAAQATLQVYNALCGTQSVCGGCGGVTSRRAHPIPEFMLLAVAMSALQPGDAGVCASVFIGF